MLCRFWQLKIHEDTDRRQIKSQIEFGSDGDSVKDHAEVTKESTEDEASKDGEQEEEDDVRSLGDYGYGGQVGHTPPHTLKPWALNILCNFVFSSASSFFYSSLSSSVKRWHVRLIN